MSLVRWKFHEEVLPGIADPGLLPDWTFPINPASMDAPEMTEEISAEPQNVDGHNRDLQRPTQPMSWSWEGVLYTLADLDMLERYLDRGHVTHVTDHFDRTWRVQLEDVNATRNGSWNYPERHRYTVQALMLGRIS